MSDTRSTQDSKTHSIFQEHASSHPDTAGVSSSSVLRERGNENTHTRLLDRRDEDVSGVREENNPSQEASLELVPQLIQAGNVSSGVVNVGDLPGKEKRVCVKEPEGFSPVKAGEASEGVDRCPSEGSVSRDLSPKGDIPSSDLRAGLNDQQSEMISASSESAEKGSVTEKSQRSPQELCLTDVQQLFQHGGSDVRNEPGGKADESQQREPVVDEPRDEKAALLMSGETSGFLDGSIQQTNGDTIQDQSRTVVDLRCSLTCEGTREGSGRGGGQAGEHTQKEEATQPGDPGSDGGVGEAACQKETPSINQTASSLQKVPCLQKEKPELSEGKSSPSLYDERCPTPTLDEEPYQYTPPPGPSSTTSAIGGGETLKPVREKPPGQISTFLKPKMPAEKKDKAVKAVKSQVNPPPSAPAEEHSQIHRAAERTAQAISAGQRSGSSQGSCLSKKSLQTFKPNAGKDGHVKAPQSSVEVPSCSQALVRPANTSKSEKSRGRSIKTENSKSEPSKTSTDLKTSGLSGKRKQKISRTKNLEEQHKKEQLDEGTSENQTASPAKVNKSNSGRRNSLPADLQFKRRDSSDLKRVVQIVRNQPRKLSEMDEEQMEASGSGGEAPVEDTSNQRAQGSLRCTIFNSSQRGGSSFLEQMSQRCLQEDLTQASVEEECLIFSQQMKQVLKRSKDKWIQAPAADTHAHLRLFRSSSCSLHLQEDLEVRLDPPSFVGLKITVDVSDRTPELREEEEDTSSWVKDGWRAGGARQDTAKMDEGGAGRRGPVRHQDSGDPKTAALSNPCVKRESFHKNTKSCSKTKFRFFILETSDDPCFDETKVRCFHQTSKVDH